MGAKSNNLRILSTKVPSWVNLPESICLPFQMMEYALQGCDPVGNQRIARLINRLSDWTNERFESDLRPCLHDEILAVL